MGVKQYGHKEASIAGEEGEGTGEGCNPQEHHAVSADILHLMRWPFCAYTNVCMDYA